MDEDDYYNEVEDFIQLSDVDEVQDAPQVQQEENMRDNIKQDTLPLQKISLDEVREQIQQQRSSLDIFSSDEKGCQSSSISDDNSDSCEQSAQQKDSPQNIQESGYHRSETFPFSERRSSPQTQQRYLELNQRRIARAQEEREKSKRAEQDRWHNESKRHKSKSQSPLLDLFRSLQDEEDHKKSERRREGDERRHRSRSRYESDHERNRDKSEQERRRRHRSSSRHYQSEYEGNRRQRSRGRHETSRHYESDYDIVRKKSKLRHVQESDDSPRRKQSPPSRTLLPQKAHMKSPLDAMEYLKKAKQRQEGKSPPPPPMDVVQPPPPPPPCSEQQISFPSHEWMQTLLPLQQSPITQPPPPQCYPPPPPPSPKRFEKDNAQFMNNQTPPASPVHGSNSPRWQEFLSPRFNEELVLAGSSANNEGQVVLASSKANKVQQGGSELHKKYNQKLGPFKDTWSGALSSKYTNPWPGSKLSVPIPKQSQLFSFGSVRIVSKIHERFYEASFQKYGIKNDVELQQQEFLELTEQLQLLQQGRKWMSGRFVRFLTDIVRSWTGTVYLLHVLGKSCGDHTIMSLQSPAYKGSGSHIGLFFELNKKVSFIAMAPYKFKQLFGGKKQQIKGHVPKLDEMCLQCEEAEYEYQVLLAVQVPTVQARQYKPYAHKKFTLEDFGIS